MENIDRVEIADGVHFTKIFDDRFKTSRIAVTMLVPLEKDTVAANAMVPAVLTRCCAAYPTFELLGRKLSMMYGASLTGRSSKRGESQLISVSASCIDDRYSLDGESVFEQTAQLLCSVLFEPKLTDGCFDEEDFRQEQRQTLDAIDADFNDKRVYAHSRLLQVMCAQEAYSIPKRGTREQVEKLTREDVYAAYKNILDTARIEIVCMGSTLPDSVRGVFEERFSSLSRSTAESGVEIIEKAGEVKNHTDKTDVAQSKLILGFRTAAAEPSEDVPVEKLMCTVLGGTAHSKLFMNVREKKSLCYYCAARYDELKGIMYIESGVEKQNIEKTRDAILEQVEDMKRGTITDEEIDNAKRSLTNSYMTVTDTGWGTQGWYTEQLLSGRQRTPKDAADLICAVTKDEIVQAANKLSLDTVYVLTS